MITRRKKTWTKTVRAASNDADSTGAMGNAAVLREYLDNVFYPSNFLVKPTDGQYNNDNRLTALHAGREPVPELSKTLTEYTALFSILTGTLNLPSQPVTLGI